MFLTEEEKIELAKRHAEADIICLRAAADIIEARMEFTGEDDDWDIDAWSDEYMTPVLKQLMDLVPSHGPPPEGRFIMISILTRGLETLMATLPPQALAKYLSKSLTFEMIADIGMKKLLDEQKEEEDEG
jgi:hypothetical protein